VTEATISFVIIVAKKVISSPLCLMSGFIAAAENQISHLGASLPLTVRQVEQTRFQIGDFGPCRVFDMDSTFF